MARRMIKNVSKQRKLVIEDIPVDIKKLLPEIMETVFDNYRTVGKDDNTFIKKLYNRIIDMPNAVKKIIPIVSSKYKLPEHSLPRIGVYLFNRKSKTVINAPDINCPMRILLNFNHANNFYFDPYYEVINEKQEKITYRSDLDEDSLRLEADKIYLMGPYNLYTIRDVNAEGSPNNSSGSPYGRNKPIRAPRPTHYQRINITIDYIVPEKLMAELRNVQKEVKANVKITQQNMKDTNEQIRKLTKEVGKNPKVKQVMEALYKPEGKEVIKDNTDEIIKDETEELEINEIIKDETEELEINEIIKDETEESEINEIINDK